VNVLLGNYFNVYKRLDENGSLITC